eukprot:526266-Alexandrium_andersonii.AAC.1
MQEKEKERKKDQDDRDTDEKAKKRVKDDTGHRDATETEPQKTWWTQQEWDVWKQEQEEWRSRMETGAARDRQENEEWRRRMEAGTGRSETRFN